MATNPRFPEPQRNDDIQADLRRNAPRGGAPWVLIALIVAAAILVALIIWLPRTPKAGMTPNAANVPPQPTGNQIQLSGSKVVASPTGSDIAIQALMTNNSTAEVTGVAVTGQFLGQDGRALAQLPGKVMLLDSNGVTQDLVQAPIPGNTQKAVRIVFNNVPQGWNHEVPALTVTTVTAAGNVTGRLGAKPNAGRVAAEQTGQENGKANGQAQTHPKK